MDLIGVVIAGLSLAAGQAFCQQTQQMSSPSPDAPLVIADVDGFKEFQLDSIRWTTVYCSRRCWHRRVIASLSFEGLQQSTVEVRLIGPCGATPPVQIKTSAGVAASGTAEFELPRRQSGFHECVVSYSFAGGQRKEAIRFAFCLPPAVRDRRLRMRD